MKAYVDGEKNKGILKERGITQSALAKKMGLDEAIGILYYP
jgi:transcriptional regulator with XRE-family HTH domain